MKRQFQAFNFSIKNSSNDAVDIYIDGTIVDAETQEIYREFWGDTTSVSFKSFREQLLTVEAKIFNIYINSPGGMVTDAMAMHDLLVELQGNGKTVNTLGRGIVASAATYPLMAGENSSMSKNSWFMIHNASGYAWGDVNEVEKMAATLRKFNNAVRDFYSKATGLGKDEITRMMDAETWMTADEAKAKGFIKNVTGDSNFTNAIPKEHWQFSNMAVFNAYNSAVKPESAQQNSSIQNQLDEMKKFFQDLGTNIMNAIKGVKAPENNDHAALMNSIGEAVNTAFKNAGDSIETAVNEAVTAGITNGLPTAVKTGIDNAVNGFETRIKNLETANADLVKKNGELETEIANTKGKPSTENKDDAPAPVGAWK